jgi:ketosteroid isomerase-like protein
MSTDKNVQTVKDFFAAIGRGDKEGLLALVAEDIEWIIPGEDWPLAGTRHGHAGLADPLETASKSIETSTEPREFVAQGDRVLVVGFARGKIKATNKTFEDDWVFAILHLLRRAANSLYFSLLAGKCCGETGSQMTAFSASWAYFPSLVDTLRRKCGFSAPNGHFFKAKRTARIPTGPMKRRNGPFFSNRPTRGSLS